MERVDRVTLKFVLEQERKGDALDKINADLREQEKTVRNLKQRRDRLLESYKDNPEADAVKEITARYNEELKKLQELDRKKGQYIQSPNKEKGLPHFLGEAVLFS